MLDEPLGQLDRSLRERLVVELRLLFGQLGTTVLAVTHDQGEAFALADRVVVMRDGRIAQTGTPLEVWQRPVSAFVARFLGFDNVVDATVSGEAADTVWGKIPVPAGSPQGERMLLVRPGGVGLHVRSAPRDCAAPSRRVRSGAAGSPCCCGRTAAPTLEAECGPARGAERRGHGRRHLQRRGRRGARGGTGSSVAGSQGPCRGGRDWVRMTSIRVDAAWDAHGMNVQDLVRSPARDRIDRATRGRLTSPRSRAPRSCHRVTSRGVSAPPSAKRRTAT